MKGKMSWDHSLVKKYSSSNHFKMLNQLKTEVKKYPLNKKINTSSNTSNNAKSNINPTQNTGNNMNLTVSHASDAKIEGDNNQSTISFNNSKNFSIYNNTVSDSAKAQVEGLLTTKNNNYIEDIVPVPSTFKDRLNNVDMK